MKKFLFSALAVVVTLFATNSCVREPNYIEDPSQAVTVSYSVTLDQVQKTKTTLAELDDIAVDKLFYSVYQLTGTNTYTAIDHSDYHKAVDLSATGTADVTVKLIKGETYKVVFWAQKGTAYVSTIDKDHPLGEITIDYTASDSYAADRDAFTAFDVITLDSTTPGTDYSSTFSKEIHLKRPFAQINFGADDVAQAAVQGYAAYSSVVAVKQAASKFNVTTGEASTPVDATFKSTVLPEVAVNFDINNVTYQRVAKAFVLPEGTFTVSNDGTAGTITSPLSTTPEVSLTLTVKKGENSLVLDPRTKSNVTVRSNYRTNLLGHLITTDATFQVVVDNDYEGSTDHVSIVSLGNASGNNEITMGDAEGISSDINFGEHPVVLNNTLTINGDVTISNGASLTVNAAIEVAEGATLTLDNVTIDNASTAPQIKVSKGATLIINGGTYTATDVDQLFNLLTSTISPAKIGRRDNSTKGELIIRGGTFKGDPTAYVDTDHYTVTDNNDGTFTVAQKPVTLTVEAGDVSMKMGDAAVLKTLTVDPADTDLSGISFEYSVANVASASYDPTSGKISVNAVGVGSTVVTVKVGTATATINVTVLPADSIEVAPASLSLKVGQTSEAVTVTLNNDATVSSVVSNNTNATVNWTSGNNTFTVTGAAIGESTITVTASNGKTATVAVTVSKADAVKLAAPVLSTGNAVADETSILLSWTAVEHATGYAVSYGAESPVNVNTNEVTLSNLALATEYTISVVAKGDGDAYTDSDASNSIKVTTEKGDVTIVVAKDKGAISIVKGLTATISGVSVKYGETVLDVPVTYELGTYAEGKITVSGTTITAVDVVAAAGINIVFAGNDTYNAKTESDAITVEVTAPVLESITLGTDLVTKTFVKGTEFSSTGLVVTANYNNGTTEDVSAKATVTAPDMTTAGEKTVTVAYGDKEATYTITVTEPQAPSKTDQEITLKLGNEVIGTTLNKKYGDAAFTITAEAPSDNVVLTSKNTAVATVSGTTITILKVGEAVIEATAAETETYNAAPAKSFTLVVGKADGTLTLSKNAVTVTAGETADAITVSNTTNIGAAITATSSDPEKATVAVTNGNIVVSGVSAGTATITVTAAATDNYTAATAEIAVTVEESGLPAIKNVTVAEFNATTPSETQRYRLTGIIGGSINTKYGNFDLTDETGTVYVYGLYPEEVAYGTTNPGENYFESIGVEAGDQITIVGYRYTYEQSGKIEVMYSFHEAHVKALAAPANLIVGKTNDKKITASWDAVTGADSYTVKIGEDEIENASSPFTSASAYADGTYSVSVKAVGSTAPDSPFSAAQSVTIGEVQLANPAVFILNDMSIASGTAIEAMTVAPITLTPDKGSNSNAPKYYTDATNGNAVRCYGSNTLTLSSEKYITGVTFTTTAGGSNTLSANTGTMNSLTWTGAAKSVIFTVSGTTGQIRIATISVTWSEEAPQSYSITCASNLTGGTIEANKATAMAGEEITLTAHPAEHYLFGSWSVNNGDVTVTNDKFTMPAANVNVSATFTAAQQYAISIASGIQNGSVAVSGNITQAYEGDEVIVVPAPANGYKLKTLTYTKGSDAAVAIAKTGNDYKFIMPGGAVEINAEFEEEGQNSGTSYTKVTSAPSDWSGTYILVYEESETSGRVCTAGVDAASNYQEAAIVSGVISSNELSEYEIEIEVFSTGYSVKALGGTNANKYLEGKGSGSNGTNFNDSPSNATTLELSNGIVTITNNTNIFAYNSAANNYRWRFFKSTTAGGSGYYKPALYKKN